MISEMMNKMKWERRFLKLAKEISTWSKDPSTQVGAVLIHEPTRTVVSVGYNGFARGINDDNRLSDRDVKYDIIIHAEENCLLYASRIDLDECGIYVHPFPPCSKCMAKLIQRGIRKVVATNDIPDRWRDNFNRSISLLEEVGGKVYLYD